MNSSGESVVNTMPKKMIEWIRTTASMYATGKQYKKPEVVKENGEDNSIAQKMAPKKEPCPEQKCDCPDISCPP